MTIDRDPGQPTRWRGFDHVIFDCDSTLTTIEGIDVLADESGHVGAVEALTDGAMTGRQDLANVYEKRLDLVTPSRGQVAAVARAYIRNAVSDASDTVEALHEIGLQVYVVSGGLGEAVSEFAMHLGVPPEHVKAVKPRFDRLSGQWWTEDHTQDAYAGFEDGPLTVTDGKAEVIRELLADAKGRSLLVGDGTSDLAAASAVDLFVGFGGVLTRPRVAAEAAAFLEAPSLAPVVLLAGGPDVRALLSDDGGGVFDRGVEWAASGALTFRDPLLGGRFADSFLLDVEHQTEDSGG